MLRFTAVLLFIFLLTGCASGQVGSDESFNCSKSLCGCYKDHSTTVTIRLTDADSTPITGATLICLDNGQSLGTTSGVGLIQIRVEGVISPFCGFVTDCEVAYFRTKEKGFERPFWFSRFLRGTNDDATDRHIEIVGDGV